MRRDSILQFKHAQVNTILALIGGMFLPLGFLSGIYGMEFKTHEDDCSEDDCKVSAIPLQRYEYGFEIWWCECIVIVVIMAIWFIKSRWTGLLGLSVRVSWGLLAIAVLLMLIWVGSIFMENYNL